jgi:hypothetical protein
MIEGEILYVKKGAIDEDYDGMPVILHDITPRLCKIRHQEKNALTHSDWWMTPSEIRQYFEKR